MELRSGSVISGRYALQYRLGHGGMGCVWLARDRAHGTQVAIKLLGRELERDPEMRERFWREAEMGAKLMHEHVVRVLAYGALSDGLPYLVMEHVEGEDLFRHLRRCGQLSVCDTRAIVAQVCRGLVALHGAGIVHRDIKPANILLGESWSGIALKLADFGLAWERGASPVTQSNVVLGTPMYMSPERLTAQDVEPGCDLWSLAVVAYECLTGHPPFEGASYGAICVAIGRGAMRPPSQLRPGLPRELDAWFARALHASPARRFGSPAELAQTFAVASGGSRASARAMPRAVRHAEPSRGLRAFAVTTPLLALTVLVAPMSGRPSAATEGVRSEAPPVISACADGGSSREAPSSEGSFSTSATCLAELPIAR